MRTKLHIPAPRPDFVPRPGLIQKLESGLQGKLTLVSAPAGFGKTSVLSTWHSCSSQPFAWISLDDDDNNPVRLLSYLVASLQTVLPDFGKELLSALQSAQPPAPDSTLSFLLNEIPSDAEIVIVFDDYHVIRSNEVHALINRLVQYLPENLHLVLATRVDPPLPLPRLRGSRQLNEIRTDDLRFSVEETDAFLNQIKQLDLSNHDIATLAARTEGWIAGLQMASFSIPKQSDRKVFIEKFSGSNRFILDYLMEEVLEYQPENIRSFMLNTSILSALSSGICEAVTGESRSQEILEELERLNLFIVPLDDHRETFRYHHLFGDLLKKRLKTRFPDTISDLHQAAGEWYYENGFLDAAIGHTLAAERFELAASWLDIPAIDLLGQAGLEPVQNWLESLPQDIVQSKPNFSMAFAWIFLATSKVQEVEPHLQKVEHFLGIDDRKAGENPELTIFQRCTASEIWIIRSNLAFHHTDPAEVLECSEQALKYLDEDVERELPREYLARYSLIPFNMGLANELQGNLMPAEEQFRLAIQLNEEVGNWHLLPMATSHLAQVLQMQGKLQQAAETCRRAIQYRYDSEIPPSPLSGIAYTSLGHLEYEFNSLDKARQDFDRGIDLARSWNHWETLTSAIYGLVKLDIADRDWNKAHIHMQELETILPELQSPFGQSLIQAQHTLLHIREQNLEQVEAWLSRTDLTQEQDTLSIREPELLILARTYLALNKYKEAELLLSRLKNSAESCHRTDTLIEILVLQTLLHVSREDDSALETLRAALDLALPGGYVRVFIDEGLQIAQLLYQAVEAGIQPEYAGRLLASFPEENTSSQQTGVHPDLVEPLSQRELEVLSQIASGTTNQETALALHIAPGTVKNHLKNIYGKLNVRSRTQAAARARDLGLIE